MPQVAKPGQPPNCLNFPPDTNSIEHAASATAVVVVLNPTFAERHPEKIGSPESSGNFCTDGLFTTTAPPEQNHLSGAGWLAADVVTATEFTGIYCQPPISKGKLHNY